MNHYILETHSLTKIYGEHKASDSINIHVKKGAIYGLIGRNGAGKTTFMKMITGLSNPTSGEFLINGHSENELKTVRKMVGNLIEAPGLYPEMTAYQNLKCRCIQCGIKGNAQIDKLLALVGLSNTGKKKAGKFSLGMKQRLGIAMALVGNPELLVLDEPINGLDPQGIHEFREMLLKLNQQGITLMISSHILDELSKIATDYGIIHEGKLIEEITKEEFFSNCMDKVIIRTDKIEKSAAFLERTDIHDYTITGDTIQINSHVSETGKLNALLVSQGITVNEIYVKSESLEEHYLKLTGGRK